MKTITVFVITYNQEDVIRRALDSILSQKEWGLYQIVIGDDCSKDSTYDILLEYQHQYPDIVRPIRNEHNLGIYGNLQNLIRYRDSSDLYIICSGDDSFCDGFFKAVQEFIDERHISLDSEIGIYSDWKSINPLGKEKVYSHKIVTNHYNLWSLQIRGLICNRSLIYTKAVIDKYKPVPLDRGLRLAESLFDSQASRIIKTVYYIPIVTSIYYTGIGISKTLSKTEYGTTENIVKWEYYLKNMITDKRDAYYANYQINRSKFLMNPNLKTLCSALWNHFRGLYPINIKSCKIMLKAIIFLIRYGINYKK
jgi:glycosyltransferase involved in cell wall biosynthesis